MSYFRLAAQHRSLIAFGFGLNFFSSFGQTYFFGVFGEDIRRTFGLTHGSFGTFYSLATLASGLCLVWLGTGIDRFPLRPYARVVVIGLVIGAALFGSAPNVAVLVLAIFLLRLCGQGLMGHISMTTMSRYFHSSRGKAMSLAALGFPVGEALFPRAFVAVKQAVGWRPCWWIIAVGLAVVLIPFVERVLRSHAVQVRGEGPAEPDPAAAGASPAAGGIQKSRREVLRDPWFYFVVPAVLAPPFIATGVFFHQVHLVESEGWTIAFFTGLFAAYGATQLVASLTVGPLVDRFRASRLLPFYLLPLALALALLAAGSSPWVAVAFMALAGLSGGAQGTIVGAYWAEAYGVQHLGAIRSVALAMMVFSTAAAPIALGRWIDGGTTMERIAFGCVVYVIVASLLSGIGASRAARVQA